jgi:hypothetical protein
MRRPSTLLAPLVLVAALLSPAREAEASAAYDSPYTYDQTFSSAIRMIRVDLALTIRERDEAGGYVIFEYRSPESGARVSSGSMQLVKGKDRVHVTIDLPAMPSYHEQMMVDRLTKKLAAEHGEPVRPAPPPDEPKKPEPPKEKDGESGEGGQSGDGSD